METLLEALSPGADEWALARAIDPARLPAHIAIIMDGNVSSILDYQKRDRRFGGIHAVAG